MDIHEYESICILDFDGTLAAIVEDLASARLPEVNNYIYIKICASVNGCISMLRNESSLWYSFLWTVCVGRRNTRPPMPVTHEPRTIRNMRLTESRLDLSFIMGHSTKVISTV